MLSREVKAAVNGSHLARTNLHPNCLLTFPVSGISKRPIAYASEMRAWPHARSLEALEHLARWRGAQVGVEAAEAFFLLRQVI